MLLAKAIDGIYDSDPKVNPEAKKYDEISIQEIIDKKLMAVDLTASIMCLEQKMPMLVFGLERTFGGTNVLDALDNGLFLRFFHVFKTDGCRNLIVDDIYQTYDHQGKNQLNDFFHFNYLFKFVSR